HLRRSTSDWIALLERGKCSEPQGTRSLRAQDWYTAPEAYLSPLTTAPSSACASSASASERAASRTRPGADGQCRAQDCDKAREGYLPPLTTAPVHRTSPPFGDL